MANSVPDNVMVIRHDLGEYGESIGPVDYGCVRRYRHRRLVTFLWLHGFRDTLRGLLNETDAFMSVEHLARLVQQGLWDDADRYVSRFLRPVSHLQSDEAQVLIHFLRHHKAFASMVAGEKNRDLKYFNHKHNTRYLKHDDSVSHDALRIRCIVLSLLNSQQVRASLDWDRVRHKASLIVQDLAYKAPELKDLALFQAGPMMPHDVLPIGFRSRRRRYVKEQDLPRAKTLTKIFLRTKKRLPSSTHSQELSRGLTDKTRKWMVDLLDESLQAGSRLELQSSGKEGVPGATVSHTMSNTLTDLTKNSVCGTSSLENAGAPVAAISQTANLTSHAEKSGISAVINADESLQAGSLELQSSGKKGVPGATVSHTMSNTLTALTKNSVSGTSSLANADALVNPVSQIMSGTVTVPAKISGAPVAAVSQTVNLTSHAENSGISTVINAGTSKLLSSENSNPRKHPRTEETIFEQEPHPKMQRTSGAFGEACLTSVTEGEAGTGSHASIFLEGPNHEIEHV